MKLWHVVAPSDTPWVDLEEAAQEKILRQVKDTAGDGVKFASDVPSSIWTGYPRNVYELTWRVTSEV